jgi:pimeloyl-ACP methyl ester carboxylesterase
VILVKVVFYLIVLIALVPAVAHIIGRWYKLDRHADVIHYVKTQDGWSIALHEYRPVEGAPKRDYPLLICHGLGGNHYGFDFQDDLSLARFLSSRGHSVFLLDLRGSGDSEKVGILENKRFTWNFDSYLRFDIPAAIDGVLKITGAKKLHWAGHSMGGMLGYALAQAPYAEKVASFTAISSPGDLDHVKPLLAAKPLLERTRRLYLQWLTQIAAPFMEWSHLLQKLSGNENLKHGHYAISAANLVEDIPISLLMQFGEWIKAGTVGTKDGKDLIQGLADIRTPFCAFAGEDDVTAMPDSVRGVYEKAGSPIKKFHVFGRSHGCRGPYGHMTPLIGMDAREESYPLIADWFEKGYKGL